LPKLLLAVSGAAAPRVRDATARLYVDVVTGLARRRRRMFDRCAVPRSDGREGAGRVAVNPAGGAKRKT